MQDTFLFLFLSYSLFKAHLLPEISEAVALFVSTVFDPFSCTLSHPLSFVTSVSSCCSAQVNYQARCPSSRLPFSLSTRRFIFFLPYSQALQGVCNALREFPSLSCALLSFVRSRERESLYCRVTWTRGKRKCTPAEGDRRILALLGWLLMKRPGRVGNWSFSNFFPG